MRYVNRQTGEILDLVNYDRALKAQRGRAQRMAQSRLQPSHRKTRRWRQRIVAEVTWLAVLILLTLTVVGACTNALPDQVNPTVLVNTLTQAVRP